MGLENPRRTITLKFLLIMTCLLSIGYSFTQYSCTITGPDGTTHTGSATYQCDPRCIAYPQSPFAGLYCCLSSSQTSNYDCLYQCNLYSSQTLVGNVYLWPAAVTPTRCDTYCPPHYYVLSSAASGAQCSICHSWCGDCTDQYCYTCTTCDPTAYRLNSTGCYNIVTQSYGTQNPCSDGFYGLEITMTCAACPTGCATCAIYLTWEMPGGLTSATNFTATYSQAYTNCTGDPLCAYTLMCYSCTSGYTNLQGACYSNSQCFTYSYYTSSGATFNPSSCNCFPNFQLLGSSICKKCNIMCLTCSGSSSSSCQTCPPGTTNSSTFPSSCGYNSTYSQLQSWVSSTPSIGTAVSSNGFYKTVGGTTLNQMSCSSSTYVFGYYGYNNNGTYAYTALSPLGSNLFPDNAALIYNNPSLPAHYGIHIRATLLFIDQWINNVAILFIENGINRFQFTYQMQGVAGEYLCGLNYDDHMDVVDDWFTHTNTAITDLKIKANTLKYAWGIKELIIHALICDISCSSCSGPTSSDCTACPVHQVVVNGVCVCDSANDYYATPAGTCTQDCGTLYRNPYTYSCVTACSWPYAFGYHNSTFYQCLVSCPTDYYKNYTTNTCISSCYISSITNPSSNYYMFGGADRMCNQTCPNGTYGDPQSGSCVRTCPAYNNATNDGYFSSGSFCYQVCPLTTLFAYLPRRACLTSCPSGYFKNYVTKNSSNASICEQQCSVTLSGTFLFGDNNTGYCTDYCSTGTYGDIDTNLCLSVCNSTAFAQSILNTVLNKIQRLCVTNCSYADGLFGNPLTGFCVTSVNCPTNYYADNLTSLCTRNCSGALQFGDNTTKTCITGRCSNSSYKDNQTKICVKTCLNNDSLLAPEYGDNTTGYCVANCYGSYYADDQHNMECVLICSASPVSTFGLNNVCIMNCSSTTWADIYNPARTCTTSCLWNSTIQSYGLNGTRECVLYCLDYQFADISTGIPLCIFGCPVNPDTTKTGLFGNVQNNKCEETCPSPYYGDQTGNRTCVLLCPWPYFGQDCVQSGGTFTYSNERQCHQVCACGWADKATQLCVWNSTGCANYTFAHESNHKCVVSTQCTGYADPITRYCINPCFKDSSVIYFADNSTKICVTICPLSPNYYGDNSTQECVLTCPNTTVRDPQNMRRCVNLTDCSTSPLYLFGDTVKDLCVTALNCSDGYYGDNTTHQCIKICPGPVLLYADNVTKECVSICELNWYSLILTSNMTQNLNINQTQGICSLFCPDKQWADNKTVSCTTQCSASTYGVNYTGSWVAFNVSFTSYGVCQNDCPDGQFARDIDNLCVFDCGPGLWGDYLSKTCKTSPFDCPSGYYANNHTNLCVVPLNCSLISTTQYVADNLTKTCVSICPSTVHNFADLNKFLCVSQCPHNYYGHNSSMNCQTNCTFPNPSVFDGTFADPQINLCVAICSSTPIATFGQNITFTCVEAMYCPTDTWAEVSVYNRKCWSPCPYPNMKDGNAQMYGDNLTHTCVTTCPTYTYADLSQGFGLCVNICPKLSNGTLQFADNYTKSCVTICPSSNSTFGDNSTLKCVYRCPKGSYAQPLPTRYCVSECSLGTWGEILKNTCVNSPLLCPTINGTLYYADNITTMCITTCPKATNSTPDYWGENTTRLCLPSCLLSSGLQSGYKWNSTRICIDQCPVEIGYDGSYSDQGMCYYVCMTPNYFRDPQFNRSCQSNCSFTPIKQYADNTTMKCLAKCPTFPQQLYAYDPTKTCQSTCPNSYRKYQALKTCVATCPNGTFFNSDTYQCLSKCPLSTSTNKTLYGDPSLAQPACVEDTSCSTNYYADSNVGLCVQNCSMGQWIYGKDCVSICPVGQYGNPNTLKCVTPQYCPSNYYADNVTVTCVSQCSGSFADTTTYSCVFRCPIVGSTVYYADPSTRICSTTCSNATYINLIKNLENQTCVSICDPGSFMDPFSNSCQSSCSNNYYADNSSRLCVSVCPINPYLFGENHTYTCVENCLNASQFKYISGRVCVTDCPTGTFRDNNTRICESSCTNFTYADTISQYCVSNCTPNYAYDPTNLCVGSCNSPYFRDPTTYKCVLQCPTYPRQYYSVEDTADRRCDVSCPSSQFRDFETLKCVSTCPASPITYADETSGNCLAVCSADFYGYTTDRTCLNTCPSGMYADPLTRMCVSKCNPLLSYYGDSTLSIPACVSICSSGTYADPFTQTCVYGCNNSPKMYAFDNGETVNTVRSCVYSCPYPYVADNSTSICKIICTSPSYPYVDQSLQQCVSKCSTPVYQYAYMPTGQTVNGNCVKFCPNGTFALLTNNSCVTKCPNGLYGSTTNNTCSSTCNLANNEYADPYDNMCVLECHHSGTYYSYADEFSRKCVRTCPTSKGTYGDKLIWKCVKRCSNLTQFADSLNGTCVSQCPPNYFADSVSQTCVSNCSISTLSYGDTTNRICVGQCLSTTLYADDSTRLCVASSSCPTGFFGFNTTRVCVARCPTTPNLFGDPISHTCVYGCQSTYFADFVSRTCTTLCPAVPALFAENNTQICMSSCPNNSYSDNYTRYCIEVCSTIPIQTFADNTTNQCVATCPTEPNYYASNYTWECVLKCPTSPIAMYADNSTRSCVYYCPRGIINTYADDLSGTCVDICPGNTYNENSTHQCVPLCLTGYADPHTKYCIAVCPHYTYGDNKTLSCVTGCPVYNGQQTYAEDGNNICMYTCMSVFNTFRDDSTKRCVKICPISEGYFADLSQRQCLDTCPISPLTYADFSTRYCVGTCPKIPALFAISQTNRVCVAVCPNGTWSDNNTRTCLVQCLTTPQTFGDNSTWACVTYCPSKPFTFADNYTHTCVPVCPSGQDYYGDNVTQKCVLYCPKQTYADPVSRRCVTTCPLGYFGQNATRRCVQQCPWREFADNLTHLCVAKCSVDPIFYGNPDSLLCVPLCPIVNSSFGNPLTQQCVDYQSNGTSGCPISYFADNYTRLCVQVCPMDQDTYGDNSTWKCVIQCPIIELSNGTLYNTYSDNSTMKCVNVCPIYPDFYGEPYSRRCVHFCLKPNQNYTGSFSDNSTRTCVQTCPTIPDFFSDNSTGRCVYYCPRYPLTFADNSTRRCVTECPSIPNIYGDLKTLRCVPQCPRDQDTYADYTTRLCVFTCPSSPPLFAENITLVCVSNCPNNSYSDNSTRRCVKICPRFPQTYGDPSTNQCVSMCPSSPDLYADPNTQMCIDRCPTNFYAENITRRCLEACLYNETNYADNLTNRCVLRCPASELTYGDNETQACVSQCPSQPMTYADNITQMCVVICNNVTNGGYADNVSRICVTKCPDLSYGDITTRYCVRYCPVRWYAYTIPNLCVQNCPSPYFADNSTWRCVLKCPVGHNLFGQTINNTCVGVCPEGTYASEENQQCVTRCPNRTQTVLRYDTWGYNDTNYCVDQCPIVGTVDLYGYPVAQVCVTVCPDPYYPNITDHRCYICPAECASCTYPQLCLTCNVNHYLYSGACVESCPTFPVITYANPNRVCGTAYQCTQGFYALNATKSCVQTCPGGFFVNVAAQACDSCIKGCISCKNGQSCITCNNNISIWSNYNCYLFCSARKRFYGTTGCVSQCPDGTYLNLTTCQVCSSTCKTCQVTAQNCLICAKGLYQSNGICVSTCPSNTIPKVVNSSQVCVSCSGSTCQQQPLTFTTSQFSNNLQYTVQVQFNQAVNIADEINKVIQIQQKGTKRLLTNSYQYLNYTIIDYGNGLYSFVLNDYNPSSNSQIQVQITNPSAIMGADGQIPSVTRSSFAVDTTIIYSASDYNSGIDFYLYALCIYAFLLLIATFGMEHSIWMPMYDFLQLVMALILINVNYPPDLLYSIFKVFASALTFLPNIFTSLFSQASYNATFINNNIYSVMQDSSFLRVMGHLYFILIILAVVLLVIFIFTKKSPSKQLKKWCKGFIREIFWKKHLHGLITLFFLPVFVISIFNMQLYSYFNPQAIQGFSIFSSYLFMILFLVPILYWTYKLRKTVKMHPIIYMMLQKAYNFILLQETVLVENKNNNFTHENNEVDLSNTRQPKINELLIFPYPIETKVGPWEITQPLFNYLHKFLTAIFLSLSFNNPVIQIILLILLNIGYMIYFIVRRPFYRVKNREYNNQIYIHNLLVISLVQVVLLIFVFMNSQLTTSVKVLIGDIICGIIIEGATVNIIYFTFRTYNYHHEKTWKPFVRSDLFRINYTIEYLEWTKSYDEKEKKLMAQIRPRNEFLAAIKIQTGQALANMAREMSLSTNTKEKIKALQLRPNRGAVITNQYTQIMKNLANDKDRSHQSVASSERLSKQDRKKVRQFIFGEKQLKENESEKYEKLNMIEERSEIHIQGLSEPEQDNEETQYEYEYIEEEYPDGTPMDEILKGCKKGDVILPL